MKPSLASLVRLVKKLPERYRLHLCVESVGDEDERELNLVAYLYEEAPENGWPSRAAYFGHAEGGPSFEVGPSFAVATGDLHRPAVRCAVNTSLGEIDDFVRLTMGMVRVRAMKQKDSSAKDGDE